MTPIMTEKRVINTEEAADILHISVATLRNWLPKDTHGIRKAAHKVGGQWLFFRDELEDWIMQHKDQDETPN